MRAVFASIPLSFLLPVLSVLAVCVSFLREWRNARDGDAPKWRRTILFASTLLVVNGGSEVIKLVLARQGYATDQLKEARVKAFQKTVENGLTAIRVDISTVSDKVSKASEVASVANRAQLQTLLSEIQRQVGDIEGLAPAVTESEQARLEEEIKQLRSSIQSLDSHASRAIATGGARAARTEASPPAPVSRPPRLSIPLANDPGFARSDVPDRAPPYQAPPLIVLRSVEPSSPVVSLTGFWEGQLHLDVGAVTAVTLGVDLTVSGAKVDAELTSAAFGLDEAPLRTVAEADGRLSFHGPRSIVIEGRVTAEEFVGRFKQGDHAVSLTLVRQSPDLKPSRTPFQPMFLTRGGTCLDVLGQRVPTVVDLTLTDGQAPSGFRADGRSIQMGPRQYSGVAQAFFWAHECSRIDPAASKPRYQVFLTQRLPWQPGRFIAEESLTDCFVVQKLVQMGFPYPTLRQELTRGMGWHTGIPEDILDACLLSSPLP